LHDLLQHYEEAHVKFEDDDVPAMVADDDNQSAASSSATSSQPPSPKASTTKASGAETTSTAGSDGSALDANEHLSAFDTTIMRSPFKGKKRSFGQFASNSSNAQMHLNLRRALIDGGLGRSNSRSSSVYSANSPFTTPGNSVPGTPTMDTDVDSAFFGNGSAAPAFSSLSLRGASGEEHDLPSCAPPNLFFPAAGSSNSTTVGSTFGLPPTKQAKLNGLSAVSSALENSLANPGALGDRPYKCTSPGCDKAYKQMNGLKYHRLHGQCNQNMLPPQQQLNSVVNDNAASSNAATASATSATSSTTATGAASGNGSSTSAIGTSKSSPVISNNAVTSPLAISTSRTASPTRQASVSEAGGETSPTASSPDSTGAAAQAKQDKIYICQVGACGKRYKNLNGLRYHYLHSGSHGLLGLQLLHANGGGASARADATTGRPAISTNDLSSDALAAAAQAAAAQQQALQQGAALQQQSQQASTASATDKAPSTDSK
jgi:transcription factor SFP1